MTPGTNRQSDATRSKKLSWLLRHGAREQGLVMDSAGFAAIADVLAHVDLSRAALEAIVAENNKSRYEIQGDRIRAVQGHSLDGTPVTREGLESTWEECAGDAPLFHGTTAQSARSILAGEGIHAAARTHVHLAPARSAVVGKRARVDVLLVVDTPTLRACGFRVFRAPNGVLLAREVPRSAITDVVSASRAGESALAQLRTLLS